MSELIESLVLFFDSAVSALTSGLLTIFYFLKVLLLIIPYLFKILYLLALLLFEYGYVPLGLVGVFIVIESIKPMQTAGVRAHESEVIGGESEINGSDEPRESGEPKERLVGALHGVLVIIAAFMWFKLIQYLNS